ncbi:MAG: hypothetical protein KC506_03700, partial [Nanoarchaeota archaeon]|nr:hypothetical protein [Nanoarchaeota archaeon]
TKAGMAAAIFEKFWSNMVSGVNLEDLPNLYELLLSLPNSYLTEFDANREVTYFALNEEAVGSDIFSYDKTNRKIFNEGFKSAIEKLLTENGLYYPPDFVFYTLGASAEKLIRNIYRSDKERKIRTLTYRSYGNQFGSIIESIISQKN